MKILLTGGDTASDSPFQSLLDQGGFDVVRINEGQAAEDCLLALDAPRVAILSWRMPGKDGVSVCREVRAGTGNPYVYLILLIPHEDIALGFEAGADDCILESCSPGEMMARVRMGQRIVQLQDELFHEAHYDPLTGLPNRVFFMERLTNSVRSAKRSKSYQFAVLFIDIDRFKVINDNLGHLSGDELVKGVAQRLLGAVEIEIADSLREHSHCDHGCISGMVARIGGDEFVILLDEIASVQDAIRVSERIQAMLAPAFHIGRDEAFITVSIGISTSGEDFLDATEILRSADSAMYKAKILGSARYEVSDPAGHTHAARLFKLERDLRGAIDNNELEVHYQPIVRLTDCRITSFEALARWRHPVLGLIQPGDFIPIAEETGLILSIGAWVMHEACRQMQEWQTRFASPDPTTVCVNISPKQFEPGNLVECIRETLKDSGLKSRSLELEVTENLTMQDAARATNILHDLSDLGVSLSLDDFGTGYSSLSYLHKFPICTLKIDRSFIAAIAQSDESCSIVQTIIALGHNLGMKVIAEGVETVVQMEKLRAFGCDLAQGYLFSRPVPAVKVSPMLIARNEGEPLPLQRVEAEWKQPVA